MLALALASSAFAVDIYAQTQSAKEIVWVGADYSVAEFYVPERFSNPEEKYYFEPGGGLRDVVRRFQNPKEAFDTLTAEWNTMLQNLERKEFEKLIARDITVDLPTPAGQTSRKGTTYFVSNYEAKNHPPTLNEEGIAGIVKKYRLKEKDGMGLVFIVERMSADDKEGCVWPTWFDLKKGGVLDTERLCDKPGGGEFRNRWLKPVTAAAQEAQKLLKDEAKK